MILTGKSLNIFEEYLKAFLKEHVAFTDEVVQQEDIDFFYKYPESMQWGVYQDWADSLGYSIEINAPTPWGEDDLDEYSCCINERHGAWSYVGHFETRQEARNAAIETLNQIINEK